jgi:hypothetical protein
MSCRKREFQKQCLEGTSEFLGKAEHEFDQIQTMIVTAAVEEQSF